MTPRYSFEQDELKVLLELYKVAVEEYRFQINLNWDRSKFYVVLNSTLITATCGLLRIPGFKFAELLTAPLVILGLLTSWLGYKTLIKGIEYRRRVVLKKAQLENKLAQYSTVVPIDTTAGMREAREAVAGSQPDQESEQEARTSLDDSEKFIDRPPRFGTISYFLACLFILLMVINGFALFYLLYDTFFLR